jgi:hypothetical protein
VGTQEPRANERPTGIQGLVVGARQGRLVPGEQREVLSGLRRMPEATRLADAIEVEGLGPVPDFIAEGELGQEDRELRAHGVVSG